jgi:hypothetical protein
MLALPEKNKEGENSSPSHAFSVMDPGSALINPEIHA